MYVSLPLDLVLPLACLHVGTIAGLASSRLDQLIVMGHEKLYWRSDAFKLWALFECPVQSMVNLYLWPQSAWLIICRELTLRLPHPVMSCQTYGTQAAPLQMVRFESRWAMRSTGVHQVPTILTFNSSDEVVQDASNCQAQGSQGTNRTGTGSHPSRRYRHRMVSDVSDAWRKRQDVESHHDTAHGKSLRHKIKII